MKLKIVLSMTLLLLMNGAAFGQRTLEYDAVVVPQNRIDARDLGYPPIDVIPNGESAVTALTVAPNGNVYGATSGKRSHLFVFNPRHGIVQPLGYLPETTAVTQAVVVSKVGAVYIGTAPGGHLLKYVPGDEYSQPIEVQTPVRVSDLGVAVKGESIFCLAIDRERNVIYGLTSPNAHFFAYAISTGAFRDWGVVATKSPVGEKFETQKMFSRMLAVDGKGAVYASGENGFLYRFASEAQGLERLPVQAPAIPGREGWTRVDAFVCDAAGLIYGGTSDGNLFRFHPETVTLDNLGKPLLQYRVGGLVIGPGRKLYGVGGDQDDLARLFSYDPMSGSYEILGFVDVNRRPYYTWQAYVIQAMVAGLDGTIYLGESERISKLYLFYPINNY
jgi:hypothetical protein